MSTSIDSPRRIRPAAARRGDAATPRSKLSLEITQAAVDAIGLQIAKRGRPETALRVGIRGGGCSGFSYVIEFHDGAPNARDVVYDRTATNGDAVRIVVDKKSLLYLNGSTLDGRRR